MACNIISRGAVVFGRPLRDTWSLSDLHDQTRLAYRKNCERDNPLSPEAVVPSPLNDWIRAANIGWVVRTRAEASDGATILRTNGFVVDVVDVTGAGDTFGGTLTWGLAQGHLFAKALNFAVTAASRSVTIHGPRGGKASAEEICNWSNGLS